MALPNVGNRTAPAAAPPAQKPPAAAPQAQGRGGWATGLAGTAPARGGVYVEPGVFKVQVLRCLGGESRKRVPFFLAELSILESNNERRPAGGKMTWYVAIKPDTSAMSNIKTFLATAYSAPGASEEEIDATVPEITDEVGEFTTSAKQPLKGAIFKAIASNIQTGSGGDFTVVDWTLIESAPEAQA